MAQLSVYVKAFQQEQFDLFDDFYAATSKQVFFTIKKYIKDEMTVEDIMQDVYVKFLKKINQVKLDQNIKSYLTTMARNASIDYLRKQTPVTYDDNHVYSIYDDQKMDESYLWLLDTLPKQERDIVYLHVIEEQKFKDIAAITNEPIGTVLWRYKKAMTSLKEALKTYES